jgi:DNA-binding transcriptional ArsR family regulator
MSDVCEIFCFDEKKVQHVQEHLQAFQAANPAKRFRALADETRCKIAYALSLEKELCVCDVANIIGATVANASHHLRYLHNMGLVNYRKEGKLVFYCLQDSSVKQLLLLAVEHESGKEGSSFEQSGSDA